MNGQVTGQQSPSRPTLGKVKMPSVRKLPPGDVLLDMAATMTNAEIGDQYGVTAEAVRQALAREGFRRSPDRPSHGRYIPWKVRADHTGDVLARRLRSYSKRQQGKPLNETEERLLDDWLRFMDGGNAFGVQLSVHYDRYDEEGFWLEPRQPGDRDYISPPA